MTYDKEYADFVNEEFEKDSDWCATNVILKICGDHVTLTEAHERNFYYGGTRRKKEYADGKIVDIDLGRSSEATEEQKAVNANRIQKRRDNKIRDLMNCNEHELCMFETLTGHGDYQNLTQANNDRRQYFDRLERFVRAGKLHRKPVKNFTPNPAFELKALGVPEFQDGHRNANGIGTGNVHFHHFHNTPYLPQVNVIHARIRDPKTLAFCEVYLSHKKGFGFYWSKAADRQTPWFNSEREAREFLRAHRGELPGLHFNVEPKKLCVNALLWSKGHTNVKKLQDLRKQGKLSSSGEYLCQYNSKGGVDDRLRNHRGWYKRGKLAQPEIYRDVVTVNQAIKELDLWKYFTHQYEFIATFMGAMTKYFFNFWVEVYPWIKRMYELKAQHKRMTWVDWLACGLEPDSQPLLL